jgi:hypothetical protein
MANRDDLDGLKLDSLNSRSGLMSSQVGKDLAKKVGVDQKIDLSINLNVLTFEQKKAYSAMAPYSYPQDINAHQFNEKLVWFDWINIDGGKKYKGQWTEHGHRKCGKGVQIDPDGTLYEGHWVDDKPNGKGRVIHINGDVYDGDWVDGVAQGEGTYTYSTGAVH